MNAASELAAFDLLNELKPDLFIVISFGKLLKKNYLALPPLGAINVHASLLPKYRGASPMQSVILNGEDHSGVCVMRMVEALDSGPIQITEKIRLDERESILTLEPKLSTLAAQTLMKSLASIQAGTARWTEQESGQATYCGKIQKNDGKINWVAKNAVELDRQIRAYLAWPGSYTFYKTKRLLIKKCRPVNSARPSPRPGQISGITAEGISVGTLKGDLLLEELQLEGRNPLAASELLKGCPLKAGELLE